MPLLWTGHVLVCVILGGALETTAIGIWWILLSCLAVGAGAALGDRSTKGRACFSPPIPLSYRSMIVDFTSVRKFILIGSVIGSLYCFSLIRFFGTGIPGSGNDLATFSRRVSLDRYSQGASAHTLPMTFLSMALFLSPALAGLMVGLRGFRKAWVLTCVAFFPSALNVFLQTTRSSLAYSGFIFVATWWASGVYSGRSLTQKGLARSVAVFALSLSVVVPVVLIAEDLRLGKLPTIESLLEHAGSERTMATYFAHVAAFSAWFDTYLGEPSNPTFGSLTFSGPLKLLGIAARRPGIYQEAFISHGGLVQTNIYTVWRGLVEDFTAPGSLAVLFVAGAVGGAAFGRVANGKRFGVPVLIVFYSFWLNFVVSVFVYNTLIFSYVALGVFWWMQGRRAARRHNAHDRRVGDLCVLSQR